MPLRCSAPPGCWSLRSSRCAAPKTKPKSCGAMIAKAKHQRLVLILIALAAVFGAIVLAMWGLRDRAAYFYTPAEVAAGKAAAGKSMRLGGMVEKGSIQHLVDGVTI